MKFLIRQNLGTKISLPGAKFLSSLAVTANPSTPFDKHDENLTTFSLYSFLNECRESGHCTRRDTEILHTQLLKTNMYHSNIFVANSLISCYCKSAAMDSALQLFDEIPVPNVFSWNHMISGYNETFLYEVSWRIFCRMQWSGYVPNQFTYWSVLSACSALQSPLCGKQIYALAIRSGFFSNGYVRTGMIELFVKCSSFEDAMRVLYDVWCENVVCWNAIISGAVRNKENWLALNLFRQMCRRFLLPNSFTFSSILTACASLDELELGRGVQGWVVKCGAREDVFVETAVIDLYAKCGDMDEAVKEFFRMPIRNVVSWTAIISGFVQRDDTISAVQYFKEMRKLREEINNYTITSVLAACSDPAMVKEAIQIHCWIYKVGFYSDSAVKASLINSYSKAGAVGLSELVFRDAEDLKHRSTWAVMISAFAQHGSPRRAIYLFQRMLHEGLVPDNFCSSSVLSIVDCLNSGRQIHCYTIKSGLVFDVSVASSLFMMYSKCGCLEDSYEVFGQIVEKDTVSWASMIAGFAEHGCGYHALNLFRQMLREGAIPDGVTLTAVLTACTSLCSLRIGKQVHAYALLQGVAKQTLVGGSLVNMYSKCGSLYLARRVFDMTPFTDQVSCSSLLSGYAESGYIEEAFQLFHEMLFADFKIDSFTISSLLGAVVRLNRLGISTQMHAHIIKGGLESEVSVGSSLVTMYSKCGSIDDCHKVFEQIGRPDLISWTAIIASYAQHGEGAEALRFYELMRKAGTKPDSVTFIGVLSACSHNGLVEEGYYYLKSMVEDFALEPGPQHYACMVDLLGRSGRLKEAERFVKNMPIKPNALVWGRLLAACKVHGDVELGRLAAKKVFELEPCNAGAYVSLSNIWADVGEWNEVMKIRTEMKGGGVEKEPGWSYV
ncbi:hypothetical protein RJ640_010601 [Escallonia rubra]|uniref:Pentatricopeptide repeat-containing protein n=1 Tax=Escallonia rubra TaxID=112253 RepID=A0AA88U9B9_9ASTE|nr:hypothetical protein RJ640_010601 [Escallonia rubra]